MFTGSPSENSRISFPQCFAFEPYFLQSTVVAKSGFMMSKRVRIFRPYFSMEGDSFVVPCGVILYLQRNELSFLLMHAESPDTDLIAFLYD